MQPLLYSIRSQFHFYLFMTILFIIGIVVGVMVVHVLSLEQQSELKRYMGEFVLGMGKDSALADHRVQGTERFIHALWFHGKWFFFIFLLALSIIGFPIIFLFIFAKGLCVGFAISIWIHHYTWKGALFACVSILPQNMMGIPLLIFTSGSSLAFAIHLIKHRLFTTNGKSMRGPMRVFFTLQTGAAVGLVAVAALTTWISPTLMNWTSSWLFIS